MMHQQETPHQQEMIARDATREAVALREKR
jgi:hypothetical protein